MCVNWILGENPGLREKKTGSVIVCKLSFHCNLIARCKQTGRDGVFSIFFSLNYSSSQKRLTKARASKITG